MKQMSLLIFSLVCLMPLFGIETRIEEVTLFADRALITRRAEVDLPQGVSEITLDPLPAWVNPASIRAKVEGGEVLDVMTRREFLAQTPDEEIRKMEVDLQALMDQLSVIHDRRSALEHSKKQIMQIGDFVTGTLPAETMTRDIPVAYFREMVDYTQEGSLNIAGALRDLATDERQLLPEINVQRQKLQSLKQGNQLEQLIMTLRVKAEQAGKAQLEIVYELPGATWEVAHDVRIQNGNQVKIVSLGQVRQTTGEDWENVKISFSTRRPGQTARIPELETLLLGQRHAVNPVAFGGGASSSGWSSANAYFMDNGLQFNRIQAGKGKAAPAVAWDGNWAALQSSQRQSEALFVFLEQRGTTALFEAEGRYTVRTDGNPVRIPYAAVAQEGSLTVMAAPEVSLNAARAIDLTYTHSEPLLPGNAALFLEGAYIGNTRLEFAGPGENFVLFAGSEDHLKVSRTLNHKESELQRGRKRNTMTVYYEIEVENTGDRPLDIKLADRIPVSDNKEIEVDRVKITPEVMPDEAGLLFWETQIAANSKLSFTLQYEVEYPNDLQLQQRIKENRELNGMIDYEAGIPAANSAEQILNLEKIF